MNYRLTSMVAGFLVLVLLAGASYAADITVRKGGSQWAELAGKTIRINGSIVGEFAPDGTVRKSGSIVGKVESDGTIRKNGSIYGSIQSDGTLRVSGSIVGAVENGGTIRKSGSIWGSANNTSGFDGKRAVSAILIFFSDDF